MARAFPYQQVVIVGGTGMTGHCLLTLAVDGYSVPKLNRHFDAFPSNVKLIGTSRQAVDGRPAGPLSDTVSPDVVRWSSRVQWARLNLEDSEQTVKDDLKNIAGQLDRNASTAVIVAAAYTNVDGCETDPQRCEAINGTNTREVLSWAREWGADIAFYSTDYVFDGKAGPYSEDVPRHAISVYGNSKVAVEEWLETHAANRSLIVRTTGVYDYLPGSKNFLMQMIEAGEQKRQVRIPSDQIANPVWAVELAWATWDLLIGGHRGIYNVAGGEQMPRVEFARTISNVYGFGDAHIQPILTKELGQKAARPLRGGLICEKVERTLGWAPHDPRTVLEILKWKHKS